MAKNKIILFLIGIISTVTLISVMVFSNSGNKYTIKFDTDGGNDISSVVVKENDTVKVPNDPTKDYHVFSYWSYNEDEYDFSTLVTEDITLLAVYTKQIYSISYMVDNEVDLVEEVEYEEVATSYVPEKEGYIFSYWAYNENQFSFDTQISGDITLVSNWIKIEDAVYCTVTFDLGETTVTKEVAIGTVLNVPSIDIDEGLMIDYWSYNGKKFSFDTIITGDITITANYKTREYKVVYKNNHVILHEEVVLYNQKALKPQNPESDGKVFLYWAYDEIEFDFDNIITEDMELHAVWSTTQYTITFVSTGTPVDSQKVNINGTITTPITPTKENAVFLYWSLDNETEFDINTPVTSSIVLYAVFTDVTYTVTYDTDGGSNVESAVVSFDELITVPTKPVKENYVFLYWSLDGEQFHFTTFLTSDIELVAVWKEAEDAVYYTVSFNSASGSTVPSQQVVDGGLATFEESTRLNYDFVCWTYNNVEFDFNTIITGNISLVAKWEIHKFSVTFDSNGGSYVSTQTIDMFSKASYQTTTRYDYLFLYWESNGEEFNFNTQIVEDVELVAVWEKIVRFEVVFNTDGGSSVDTQSIIKGYTASIPYNPTKENFVFAYWMNNGVQYDFTSQVLENIELEAHWISEEEITVTFDTDGGSHIDTVFVTNLSYLIAPSSPTKENHDFIYWELDGQQFDFNTQITKSITLTAKWYYVAPIVYHEVIFMSNSAVYKTFNVINNQTVSSFSMSTTTTHRFNSWVYKNNDNETVVFNFTDKITSDMIIEAVWDERVYHNVTFDLDGWYFSSVSYVPKTAENGYSVSMTYNYAKRELATFSHWEVNGEVFVFGSTIVYGDIHVTAVWKDVELNLTYTDVTYSYYGGSRTKTVSGTILTGVTMTYENNVHSDVGVYTCYAYAWVNGSIYETYTCTMTITALTLTVKVSGEMQYEFDSSVIEPSVTISATGWGSSNTTTASRGTFYYTIDREFKNVGTYTGTIKLYKTVNGELVENTNYVLNVTSFSMEIIASRLYNFDYIVENGEITITGMFNSLQTELIVPEYIDGYKVTSIAASAFYNYTLLKTVSLPNSITSIGYQAFRGCTSLDSINIPTKLEELGTYAFYGCTSLTSVVFSNAINEIPSYAFYGCTKLVTVVIGQSVETVGYQAFRGCTLLSELSFGSSVKTISEHAFYGCTSLVNVNLPSTVTSIGSYAFYGCTKLSNLVLEEGLLTIGTHAFYNNNALTNVTLPNSITSIGQEAFSQCDNFTSINIPRDLVELSYRIFYNNTKFTSVAFHNNALLTIIGQEAFYSAAFSEINIPETVHTINYRAFGSITELTQIVIPNSVKTFGTNIFQSCTGLTSYKLPDNIETIPASIFYGCTGLTSITIPSTIKTISSSAFYNCTNVVNIIFGSSNTIETIGASAFYGMNKMTSITIPISVKSLEATVFHGWTSLQSIQIPASTTSLGNQLFYNCTSLTSVVIPNTVTSIGTGLFQGCTNLTIATINSPITTLPGSTFYGCTSLTNVILPIGITVIGYYAFYNCKSLTSFTIPSTVTTIQYGAFMYCTGLSSIVIPSTVTSITQRSSYASTNCAFMYTTNLIIYVSWSEGVKPSGWSTYWQSGCTVRYDWDC